MILNYAHPHDLAQLCDELLTIAALQPVDEIPRLRCEGFNEDIRLTVPDDLTAEDILAIETIINSHAPKIPADWSGFRVGMLHNSGYQRIVLVAGADNNGRLAARRVETAITMDNPNLEVIEMLWEQAMAALPPDAQPTETEIEQWNTIAAAHHIPFTFNAEGKIQPS